jgi:hypothetical protein
VILRTFETHRSANDQSFGGAKWRIEKGLGIRGEIFPKNFAH